jgi:hypothetical protein
MPVQQGAADFAEVLLDLPGRATALAGGVAVETAFAPVHVSTALLKRSTGWPSGHVLPLNRDI